MGIQTNENNKYLDAFEGYYELIIISTKKFKSKNESNVHLIILRTTYNN